MSLNESYANAGEYRARISGTDASKDGLYEFALNAVSRYLDEILGWRATGFAKDASAVARVFDAPHGAFQRVYGYDSFGNPAGLDTRILHLDALSAAPTAVKFDLDHDGTYEVTLAATDYRVLPRNAARYPTPRPYTAIELAPGGDYARWTPNTLIEVTGVWGWPEIPQAIREATIELTAILLLQSPRATSQINEAGTVLGTSQEAQGIIRSIPAAYRRAVRFG